MQAQRDVAGDFLGQLDPATHGPGVGHADGVGQRDLGDAEISGGRDDVHHPVLGHLAFEGATEGDRDRQGHRRVLDPAHRHDRAQRVDLFGH